MAEKQAVNLCVVALELVVLVGQAQPKTPAKAPPAPSRADPWEIMIPLIALLGCVLILAVVLTKMRSWYSNQKAGANLTSEMMSDFRTMKEEGELSPEEYQKIKAKLAAELHGQVAPPKKPPPPPAKPPDDDDED